MKTTMRWTALIALALACCGVDPGHEPCEPGFMQCEDASTAAWCELGEVEIFDCPGGCTAAGCDFTWAESGTNCPAELEGSTFCSGPDLYECAAFPGQPTAWTVSQVCRDGETCSVEGGWLACLCPDGTVANPGCE